MMIADLVGYEFDRTDIGVVAEKGNKLNTFICGSWQKSQTVRSLRATGWTVLGVAKRR